MQIFNAAKRYPFVIPRVWDVLWLQLLCSNLGPFLSTAQWVKRILATVELDTSLDLMH